MIGREQIALLGGYPIGIIFSWIMAGIMLLWHGEKWGIILPLIAYGVGLIIEFNVRRNR